MNNELTKFDTISAELRTFVLPALEISVGNADESCKAMEAAKTIKGFQKRVEETRKMLVGPLNDQVKTINEYAKRLSEPLNNAEKHIKEQLAKWHYELEKLRIAEMERAEAARKEIEAKAAAESKAKMEEAEALSLFGSGEASEMAQVEAKVIEERVEAEQMALQKETVSNLSYLKVSGAQKRWTFQITDENLIFREYLKVDEVKIREAIRAGVREIPGVRIYQETSIAIR